MTMFHFRHDLAQYLTGTPLSLDRTSFYPVVESANVGVAFSQEKKVRVKLNYSGQFVIVQNTVIMKGSTRNVFPAEVPVSNAVLQQLSRMFTTFSVDFLNYILDRSLLINLMDS